MVPDFIVLGFGISLLFLNMLSRKNLLTENNVAGVISILVTAVLWHFNPIPLTADVRGTDFIGYSVLPERLSLS